MKYKLQDLVDLHPVEVQLVSNSRGKLICVEVLNLDGSTTFVGSEDIDFNVQDVTSLKSSFPVIDSVLD